MCTEHTSVWTVDWDSKPRIVGNAHPTEKPVELFVRAIKKHTKAGDVVFEPFSGSGSQLIAAERTARRCCAIEISPPFVDVAIRRWQKATGQGATALLGDGRIHGVIAGSPTGDGRRGSRVDNENKVEAATNPGQFTKGAAPAGQGLEAPRRVEARHRETVSPGVLQGLMRKMVQEGLREPQSGRPRDEITAGRPADPRRNREPL